MSYIRISFFELSVYFVMWIFGILFAIFKFSRENKVFSHSFDVYQDFKQGLLYFDLKKDATDFEWEVLSNVLIRMLPWTAVYILITELLRESFTVVIPYWQIAFSSIFIIITTNVKGLFFILLQPLVFECISKFKNNVLIWTTCLFSLLLICYFKTLDVVYGYDIFEINDLQHYILILIMCWTNLRCVSFYLDEIKDKEKTHGNNLVKILSYCLYFPNMICGPFLHRVQVEKSRHKGAVHLLTRLKMLLKDALRVAIWALFTEVSLHFIYPSIFSYHPKLVSKFNKWSLYGYGYWMGQFFHLKYVVFYGFSTCIAKFENIPVPATPKCIGRIHLYSDMWKYFDRGLHSFLIKYIYVPTLVKKTTQSKIAASFLCFTFVYIWHGVQSFILIWATLNFIGVTLETLFKILCKHCNQIVNIFNAQWQRRMACILASPLLAMSCVSNFYFFAGMDIGNIFIYEFFNDSALNQLLLLIFLYCCCQVSTEIKHWENASAGKVKTR